MMNNVSPWLCFACTPTYLRYLFYRIRVTCAIIIHAYRSIGHLGLQIVAQQSFCITGTAAGSSRNTFLLLPSSGNSGPRLACSTGTRAAAGCVHCRWQDARIFPRLLAPVDCLLFGTGCIHTLTRSGAGMWDGPKKHAKHGNERMLIVHSSSSL